MELKEPKIENPRQFLMERIENNLRALKIEAERAIHQPADSGISKENVFSIIDAISTDLEGIKELEK